MLHVGRRRLPAGVGALLMTGLMTGCAAAEPVSDNTVGASSTSDPGTTEPPTSGPSGSTSSSAPSTGTAPDDGVRTVDVTVTGTTVTPAPGQVDLAVGETLRLVVTADGGTAVHAHGLNELEAPITPGTPTTVELSGEVPGVYEVELHDPDLLLLQVAVR